MSRSLNSSTYSSQSSLRCKVMRVPLLLSMGSWSSNVVSSFTVKLDPALDSHRHCVSSEADLETTVMRSATR